ncbi:CBS domain-containing protein [Micromonospora sp. CPCC 206061]|uniref:CBS domain-containing protein n=1 Tax=Micromonospora sp. CPCC 206061 TaxID=3122410 RepID=UPI002FF40545
MQQWRVRDVMTREVVTAAAATPVRQIADLLTTHRISAVPIVGDDDQLVGVVSEADLLPNVGGEIRNQTRHRWRRAGKAAARSAGELMSTRPVTIPADASLATAAKKMQARNVKRLLVTGETGRLLGVVSRTDVLRTLTRPDVAIRQDVIQRVLRKTLWIGPDQVQVDVRDGVVTLTGAVGRRTTASIAARLSRQVPGVASVVDHIGYDFDDTALARSRVNRNHPFSAEPFHPERSTRVAVS